MNLAQIRTLARDLLMAGGGKNTTISVDTFWNDNTLTALINEGQRDIEKIIRRARADFFTRILRTTDNVLLISGQLYDPSELRWVAGTGNYRLPPDVIQIKLITELSQDNIYITMDDLIKNRFRSIMNIDSQSGATREYLADILGVRTLVIRPIPQEVRDFEFVYVKRLPILRDYTTGTVTVTQDNSLATFSSTINTRLNVGDELIVGTDGLTQSMPDPNEEYPAIKSINSTTQVTMEGLRLDATLTNVAYTISSVSEIPSDHHYMLVAYCVKEAFKIGPNPHTDAAALWQTKYDSMIPSLVNDVESRQISDLDNVQAYMDEELY